jgi:hypothetical protein
MTYNKKITSSQNLVKLLKMEKLHLKGNTSRNRHKIKWLVHLFIYFIVEYWSETDPKNWTLTDYFWH